jgi:hypothetical protein
VKRIKVGNALACEYATLGSNLKHTIVNAYTGDIIVQSYPSRIPLAFYVEIFPQPDMSVLKFEVMQNKKKKAEIYAEFEYEAGKIGLILIPQIPFTIEKATTIRLIASCEGYKPTVLITKKVSEGSIPAA